MSAADERVYQAEPSTCVTVARQKLDEALRLLVAEKRDSDQVFVLIQEARAWLPSWLAREWDDRMSAWLERTNSRIAEHSPRSARMTTTTRIRLLVAAAVVLFALAFALSPLLGRAA